MKRFRLQRQAVSVCALLAGLTLAMGSAAYGEDAAASDTAAVEDLSLSSLMSLTLTTGSFLELDLTKSPLNITVIEKKMVRSSGARTMSDLLEKYVPGFVYSYNRWNGTNWSMRGISNDRNTKILYLVNGHKMNTQARDGFQAETQLGLLGDIERVEVLRGPAGLVYGAGAIAGIINVVTAKAGDANEMKGSYAGGKVIGNEFEMNALTRPAEDVSVAVSAGFRSSGGLGSQKATQYGVSDDGTGTKTAAQLIDTAGGVDYRVGMPVDASFGYVRDNYKVSTEIKWKDFNWYFRTTKQTENMGWTYIFNPWPEKEGMVVDTLFTDKFVDNTDAKYRARSPYWLGKNLTNNRRMEFVTQATMAQLDHKYTFGENEIKSNVGFDMVNNWSIFGNAPGYAAQEAQWRQERIREAWGERRYQVSGVFLLRSVENLQAAFGLEDRIDDIGENYWGQNQRDNFPLKLNMNNVVYNTLALFTEGAYQVNEMFTGHGGLRADFHSRATMFNGKLAGIVTITPDHIIKAILQTSSNNGAADNYEYNRRHYGNDGKLIDKLSFLYPTVNPAAGGGNVSILIPPPSLDELHKLKPERVIAAELTSVHNFLEKTITLQPAVTYGQVTNLIAWSGDAQRCLNVPGYGYVVGEWEARAKLGLFGFGFNHSFQRPVVDTGKSTTSLNMPIVNQTKPGWFDSTTVDGVKTYYPVPNETGVKKINMVKNMVTLDGKNFLHIPKNMTKVYCDFELSDWMLIHADLRVFWGLQGREPLYNTDRQIQGVEQFNISYPEGIGIMGILRSAIKKFDLSIHFALPKDLQLDLIGKDLFATDYKRGDYGSMYGSPINAMRWLDMANAMTRGLYTVDQRTFEMRVTKNF